MIKSCKNFWEGDGKQITNRLEFGFHGRTVKVLSFNGDTIEGLFEATELQDKYAAYHGLDFSQSTSHEIRDNLTHQVSNAINGFVHIYVDSNQRNEIHALYIQKLIAETGYESRFIRDISEISTNAEGKFLDNEGREIKIVWKVCDWEKVFEDYEKPRDGTSLKMSDLLLCEEIKVLEPIWKVIASSPALLPIVWELSPNHSSLLRAEWDASGYFGNKPSVKRSYGYKSSGSESSSVFVESFETEKFGEFSPVIQSWSMWRKLPGFMILDSNQRSNLPFMCCRVVGDDE